MHVDAEMSNARILRPPAGFEGVYQGISASDFPIAIPGTLDTQAGDPGFDPNLMAGVPIPMQSRLLLWLPMPVPIEGITQSVYEYRILWRLRSSESQNRFNQSTTSPLQKGLVGHLPKNFDGVPNDPSQPNSPAQARVVLPCAITSVAYEQSEPGTTLDDGVINLRGERVSVRGRSYGPSSAPRLVPGPGNAVASQGIYPFPSASPGLQGGPVFLPYQTDAFGDEYIILASRPGGVGTDWDFQGEDLGFSMIFGTAGGTRTPLEGLGIYAFTGSGAT